MDRWKFVIFSSIIIACCLISFTRLAVYRDDLTLWGDTVSKSPFKARPHHKIGLAYRADGNLDAARKHFQIAISIKPDYAHALINLASIYHFIGNNDKAMELSDRALEIDPHLLIARSNMAIWHYQAGSIDAALREYNMIIQMQPQSTEAEFARKMIKYIEREKLTVR